MSTEENNVGAGEEKVSQVGNITVLHEQAKNLEDGKDDPTTRLYCGALPKQGFEEAYMAFLPHLKKTIEDSGCSGVDKVEIKSEKENYVFTAILRFN